MITLTKISETSSKITLGWTPVPGCIGYVFYADDTRVSNTWDPNKSQVTFSKGPSKFRVDAVGVEDTGAYPSVTPPPTGILQFKPPGYNGGDPRLRTSYPGFQYIEIGGSNRITHVDMTNGVDYFIKITSPITYTTKASDPDEFACVHLNGGRHVVVVAGDVAIESGVADSSSRRAEPIGFLIDGGTDGGIIHLEGLRIRANNPVTMRSRRILQIEYCVLEAFGYRPSSDPAHSDPVQFWATSYAMGPCEAMRMHYVTTFTDYTGFSVLTQVTPNPRTQANIINPKTWWGYKLDIHPRMIGNLGEAGAFFYHTDSYTGGNGPGWQNFGPYTTYHREVYCELPQGGGGAYVRPIDGITALRSLDQGLWIFPYEIKSPSGATLYTSPAEPTGGNAPFSVSGPGAPGNYLTFGRVPPLSDQKLIIGQPPAAESTVQGTGVQGQVRRVFVPTPNVGMGYVPKGYL